VIDVAPGTIAIYSDIACPWAHLAVFRLWAAREKAGLTDQVTFDHRPFPLEVVNSRCTPRKVLEAEVPVVAGHDPEGGAGWQMWQAPFHEWPVTTLPALEAVQAAKAQSARASETLDRALRRAFFGESRCVSMRHVILEIAAKCDQVDHDALADALDRGTARAAVMEPPPDDVEGSPHLFLPDGTDAANPGIEMHWTDEHGKGFPVIDADDPSVYDE
jgi:predicted DsbA family dithiol-disulfide isomerase